MGEVMKTMMTSFQRSHDALLHSVPPALQQATADPRLCGDSWTLLGKFGSVSCRISTPSRGPGAQGPLCALLESVSQSCASSGGSTVGQWQPPPRGLMPNPGLLHPDPLPLRRPLLTRASSGHSQTQFCLALCEASGSCCAQGMFEPSKRLWQVWVRF